MTLNPDRERGARGPEDGESRAPAGRVPPHDLDAEAAVLSAILLEPDSFDEVAEILKPEHFVFGRQSQDIRGYIRTRADAAGCRCCHGFELLA